MSQTPEEYYDQLVDEGFSHEQARRMTLNAEIFGEQISRLLAADQSSEDNADHQPDKGAGK